MDDKSDILIDPIHTGINDIKEILAKIQLFENKLTSNAKQINISETVRQLSMIEAPFRGCLGDDCSSEKYLRKALDPNYIYFTLTNKFNFSKGHVTIILGEAEVDGKEIKVAVVYKIQNIDHLLLPIMMEVLRRSVKEKGYRLAMPEDVGDYNGVSNEEDTRLFIKKNINISESELFKGFLPHQHSSPLLDLGPSTESPDGSLMRPVVPLVPLGIGEISRGTLNASSEISDSLYSSDEGRKTKWSSKGS